MQKGKPIMNQVLIVDDEVRLLQSIEAGLMSFQEEFSVLVAENGRQALDILERENISLVVTDLRMPEMDGFELLAHMSSSRPFTPTIVMTAFATPEIESRLNSAGTSKLLEKPIDIGRLAEAIREGLRQEGREGAVAGFSLANFLQLLAMEQKTCLLCVRDAKTEGHIYINRGEIEAAIADGLKGEEALFLLLGSDSVNITFKKLPQKKIPRMINKPLMSLLLEGMQRKDEAITRSAGDENPQDDEAKPDEEHDRPEKTEPTDDATKESQDEPDAVMHETNKGETEMGKLEDALGRLRDIEGFIGAGVYTPNGEMAANINTSNMKLAEIGSLANDVLLKAQKATDIMNVGRGQVVHIEAPNAHIIARCLNENQDYSQTQSGKAHVHMVMLLSKDANLAMGKIKLESVINDVVEVFR